MAMWRRDQEPRPVCGLGCEGKKEEEAGGLRGTDTTRRVAAVSPPLRNPICEDIELLFDNNEEIVPRSNRIQK